MSVTSPDFESGAYTNFATPAVREVEMINRVLLESQLRLPLSYWLFQRFILHPSAFIHSRTAASLAKFQVDSYSR